MHPDWQAQVTAAYQLGISAQMRARITHDDDPIARQFLPDARELHILDAERHDPIGDFAHSPVPFLVHRYRNRVLWKITPTCAVYCRFCFRKEFIGRLGEAPDGDARAAALDYIRADSGIEEIILSGGDPLTLTPGKLRQYLAPVREIAHVRRVRIHTRVPVVAPERITAALIDALCTAGKPLVVILHANHAREFGAQAAAALQQLRTHAMLLSQSVLLKGVNDSVAALADLMNAFLDHHVAPYYLHHLDLAKGTSHFRLTLAEGEALYHALRERLSGLALPRYIVEIPGGEGKVEVLRLSAEQRQRLAAMGIE
ncbi:MAG: KamA family radical SAM protein [Cardiobacteriaceae bacterium]|nr:KamA family radical SAM protein [Cardiobacteriaceae bacterium]